MKKWIEDLLELQEADLRLRRMQTRLEILPSQIERLQAELDEEKGKLQKGKETAATIEMKIKQTESAINEKNGEMQRLLNQSIMIKKNDEYRAMMNEIDIHKKKISDMETEQLILMDQLEDAKAGRKKLENLFKEKEKSFAEEKKELLALEVKLKEEIEKIKSVRNELAIKITPDLLSVYTRLLNKGTGEPLVKIHQENCGNCHLKLTPQTINEVKKEQRVICENCNHLLYITE